MAYTKHGHQIPGTPVEGVTSNLVRCGGPRLCTECNADVFDYLNSLETKTANVTYTRFVRRPFVVEAVQITRANIAEIAQEIGELHRKDNGTPYIQVNRRIVPNVFQVFPGFWMTKMGPDNIRCYAKKVFMDQFMELTPGLERSVDRINNPQKVEADG